MCHVALFSENPVGPGRVEAGRAGLVVRVRRDAEAELCGAGLGWAVRGYAAAFGGVDGYGLADEGAGGAGAEGEEEDDALTYGEVRGRERGRGGMWESGWGQEGWLGWVQEGWLTLGQTT